MSVLMWVEPLPGMHTAQALQPKMPLASSPLARSGECSRPGLRLNQPKARVEKYFQKWRTCVMFMMAVPSAFVLFGTVCQKWYRLPKIRPEKVSLLGLPGRS